MAIPQNNTEFKIRLAGLEDAEDIFFLVKEAFADYGGKGTNPVMEETVGDIKADLKGNLVLVVEFFNKIVGSLRLEAQMESCFYLKRFSILPGFQHQGLGTRLYQQAEKTALDYGGKFIYLHSSVEDQKLISFYKKLGFTCLKKDQENGYERGLWVKKIDLSFALNNKKG